MCTVKKLPNPEQPGRRNACFGDGNHADVLEMTRKDERTALKTQINQLRFYGRKIKKSC